VGLSEDAQRIQMRFEHPRRADIHRGCPGEQVPQSTGIALPDPRRTSPHVAAPLERRRDVGAEAFDVGRGTHG